MAKKGLIDFDDNNLGFDNDDFDDGFSTPPVRSPKNAREAVAIAAPSVLEGMKSAATDPGVIRRVMEKTLPRSFGYTLSEIDNYSASYDQLSREINREMRPTITAMTKVAARVNNMIPHPFQGKFGNYLKSKMRDDSHAVEVDAEEAAVAAMLQDGMGDQTGVLTKNKRAEEAIDKIDERTYRVKMFQSVAELRDLQRQATQYMYTQQRTYNRKVLEVQIRQLMTQRKHLEVSSRASVEVSNLLRDVVKNTGLPEYAKEQANEAFKRTSREAMFGAVQRPIQAWAQNYLRNVTKNYTRLAKERLGSFRQGMETADDTIQAIDESIKQAKEFGESPWSILGELSGEQLAEYLGSKTGEKIRKHLPYKGGIDNLFSFVTRKIRNAPYAASAYGKKADGMSLLSELRRGLYVGFDKDEGQVVRSGGLGNIKGMDYEARKVRALEEILPGYLSRILHTMEQIRTGDDSTPRTVWSQEKGSFVSFNESAQRLEKSIVSKGALASQSQDLQVLMNQMGIGTADGALRHKLGKHIGAMSATATGFTPEGILNGDINGLTPRERKRLEKALRAKFGVTYNSDKDRWESGYGSKNAAILAAQTEYRRVQQGHSTIYNNVQAAVNTGSLEELQALGIVRYDEDEKAWVIDDGYMNGRRGDAMAGAYLDDRARRRGEGKPYDPDKNPPRPSDALRFRRGGKSDEDLGFRGPAGGFNAKSGKNIVRSIEEQTAEMVHNLQELISVQNDSFDVLADILDQIQAGVTVNGQGFAPGAIGRAFRRARKGATWAGKKIWDISGAPFRGLNWARKKAFGGVGNFFKNRDIRGKINKFRTDVYVFGEGGLRKALDAIGFEEGRYTNMLDGSPIRNLRDIKGAVYDKLKQKQVISQEEFEQGLLNSVGQKIFGGVFGALRTAAGKAWDFATSPLTGLWKSLKTQTNNVLGIMLAPPDIYVPGESSPRILGNLMYKGTQYFSGVTGKPLKYLGDIDGEIITFNKVTGDRKVVISDEEVRGGLVDNKGKPLTPFFRKLRKAVDKVKDIAMGAFKLPGRIWNWGKKTLGGIGTGLMNAAQRLMGAAGKDNKLSQVYWLESIYKLMYAKFTGMTIGEAKDIPIPGFTRRKSASTPDGHASSGPARPAVSMADRMREQAQSAKDKFNANGTIKSWKERLGLTSGTEASARVKDAADDLMERSGSWLAQKKAKAMEAKAKVSQHVDRVKAEQKSLFDGMGGMLSTLLGGLFAKFTAKFGWLKPTLTGLIPTTIKSAVKWLGAKFAGDAVTDALVDGPSGRRKNKLMRRLANSKLGKFVSRAMPWVGRGAVTAAVAGGSTVASAATAAASTAAAAGSTVAAGAATAASAGAGLLTAVGSGLATIGGLLVSPWVLGAAALIGTAYVGWKIYQHYAKKKDFSTPERVRLIEYGFQLDKQHDICAKVLGLEAQVNEALTWRNNAPVFDREKLDMNAIATLFGVTQHTGKQYANMQAWLLRRFIPIYSAWLLSGKQTANISNLNDMSTLAPHLQLQIIRGSFMTGIPPEQSPYNVDFSPVPGYWITQGTQRIEAAIAQAAKELSTNAKLDGYGTRGAQPALGLRDGFDNAPSAMLKRASILPEKMEGTPDGIDDYYGASERLTRGRITGNQVSDDLIAKFNQLDDMTILRMKAYGLSRLSKVYVDILLKFEQALYKHVTWSSDGRAVIDYATPTAIYTEYATLFKLDPSDTEAAKTFIYWLNNRFLPVYTTFLAACHKVDKYGSPFSAYGRFKGTELFAVARAVFATTITNNGNRNYSIWGINALPFPGEQPNLTSSSAAVNLAVFERAVKADSYRDSKVNERTRLTTPGQSLLEQKATDLMADMQAVTGNQASYQLQQRNTNGYTADNGITASWDSAGYNGVNVSNVKLNDSAKARAEMLMKTAIAAGIKGDELAMFMGICAQETGDFQAYRERAPNVQAYLNNKGLGNTSMEDAQRYIGRGPIQLTGRANYTNMKKWTGIDVLSNPELLEDTEIGARAAVAYWINYVRETVKNKGSQMTPKAAAAAVNGWYKDPSEPDGIRKPNGWAVRQQKMEQWRGVINGTAPDPFKGGSAAVPAGATAAPTPNPTETKPEAGSGSGGQEVAPALPGQSPTSPVPSAPLAKGQEVAPAIPKGNVPSSALQRPLGTDNTDIAAQSYQVRQATSQQQQQAIRTSNPLVDIGNTQVEELRAIRKLLEGGAAAPSNPAPAQAPQPMPSNAQTKPPLPVNNSNMNPAPDASPQAQAPVAAQKTATETAAASKPAAQSPASTAGKSLPFDTRV